jgi:hypothetical protein
MRLILKALQERSGSRGICHLVTANITGGKDGALLALLAPVESSAAFLVLGTTLAAEIQSISAHLLVLFAGSEPLFVHVFQGIASRFAVGIFTFLSINRFGVRVKVVFGVRVKVVFGVRLVFLIFVVVLIIFSVLDLLQRSSDSLEVSGGERDNAVASGGPQEAGAAIATGEVMPSKGRGEGGEKNEKEGKKRHDLHQVKAMEGVAAVRKGEYRGLS